MNRFFIPQHWIDDNNVQLEGRYAHQIKHVLRLNPGDEIIVLDNTNNEYDIVLSTITEDCVIGRIKHQRACATEPKVQLTLFQSLLKRDKFEWVLQKCTEVGIAQIVPVISRRSLVQKKPLKPAKLERWQTIVREAAEQCERGQIPLLETPIDFADSLKRLNQFNLGIIASPHSHSASLSDVMAKLSTDRLERIALWIGPEGGFDPSETEKAISTGIVCMGLGKRVLRTETAAIVASALVLHELGEL